MARLTALSVAAALAIAAIPAAAQESQTDINMVVALDRSESISEPEAVAQIEGLIYALTDPRLIDAILSGWHGRIGIAVITWSSFERSDLILPWTVIADADQASAVALALHRHLVTGGTPLDGTQTDLALGLRRAISQLEAAPYVATREIINMVSDGIDNFGNVPIVARNAALDRGVTINALTMGRGRAIPVLRRYYERNVIGGPRAFVHNTPANQDFAAAMLRKMVIEVALLNGSP